MRATRQTSFNAKIISENWNGVWWRLNAVIISPWEWALLIVSRRIWISRAIFPGPRLSSKYTLKAMIGSCQSAKDRGGQTFTDEPCCSDPQEIFMACFRVSKLGTVKVVVQVALWIYLTKLYQMPTQWSTYYIIITSRILHTYIFHLKSVKMSWQVFSLKSQRI